MTSAVPHQAIYRRWRAQTFGEIVGQEAVVQTLRNAVRLERVSHAVLFVGPRGTGKTSLARILAKALNCTDLQDGDACDRCPSCVAIRDGATLDLVEIDAASNRGIDAVRDLRDRLAYPPGELRRKVYILDEAHQITKDAWNALLKSIEEPPPFVNFMFASTEPSGFPLPILSRLQRYDVRRLTVAEIEGKLRRILEADTRTADAAAVALIARLAAGGMRDAETMLDQLLASAEDDIDEQRVRDLLGLADADAVDRFVTALVDGDAAAGIALLDDLAERGRDARILLDQAIDTIRARLIEGLTGTSGPGVTSTSALTDAARRLAAIDPERAGIGGLRLQLELALFTAATASGPAAIPVMATSRSTAGQPPRETPPPIEAAPPTQALPSTAPTTADTSSTTDASPPSEPPPSKPPTSAAKPPDRPITRASRPTPEPLDDAPRPPARTAPEPSAPKPAVSGPVDAPPAIPAAATDATPLTLEQLVGAWPRVVDLLSRQPAVKQLITTCRPVSLDGAIVTLGFPEEQGFLRDVAERKRGPIETGIREVVGHDVGIRCVVANIEVPARDDLVAEARRIFADELADVGEVR